MLRKVQNQPITMLNFRIQINPIVFSLTNITIAIEHNSNIKNAKTIPNPKRIFALKKIDHCHILYKSSLNKYNKLNFLYYWY